MQTKPKEIFHRYRLVNDEHVTVPRLGLEGVTLIKPTETDEAWLVSRHKLEKLHKHVRSMQNPTGFVEYQEFDAWNPKEPTFTPPVTAPTVFFSRDELFTLTRKELEQAAHKLSLNPVALKDEALIKKILQEQKKYQPEEVVVAPEAPVPAPAEVPAV